MCFKSFFIFNKIYVDAKKSSFLMIFFTIFNKYLISTAYIIVLFMSIRVYTYNVN